jgi:tetratricopeptide (TPR) repeat protein
MEDNIVFFPKLKDRIINLGKKALEEKNYSKALMLCDQLKEMDEHNSQTELAAVACLLEGHKTLEAKIRCEDLVFGPFESDEAIEVYISILFQLKEYEELQKCIKKLLQQKRIDEPQMDKYQAMLSLTNKVAPERNEQHLQMLNLHNLVENSVSIQKQLEIINELRVIDCKLVINQIVEVLKSSRANPLIQSFILFILQEQSIDHEFEIKKMNQEMNWNAISESNEHDHFSVKVIQKLSLVLESEDPSAFELAKTHFQHFMTIYFPFIPEPSKEDVWTACFYSIVQEYFDRTVDEDDLFDLFKVDYEEVQSAITLVRQFEKEGYFDLNGG